jgi:UDP-glucose 4-epimerase
MSSVEIRKTSLVTGGGGFLGSHVADYCLKLGHRVVVLDDLSGGFLNNLPPGAEFVQGSVGDDKLVRDLFARYSFDYVYHLAAYAAEGLSHFIRRYNYQNNLVGTVTILNAAIRAGNVKRFVFTSSIAVYGAGQLPMTEELVPRPEDPYGISKYAAELDIECAERMFGLEYTIFRPHNVYGEKQNIGDRYRNVIGIFMNQVMRGEPMSVFGDGAQTRAFTHVDDIAPLIAGCVEIEESRNQVFNVGADTPYEVGYLAEVVARAFGVDPQIIHLPAREEVAHAYASHGKTERVFGTRAEVNFEEGIRRMAEWARRNGPVQSTVFENIEVSRGLPPSWAAATR